MTNIELSNKIKNSLETVIQKYQLNFIDISNNEPNQKIEFQYPAMMLNAIISDVEHEHYEYDIILHSESSNNIIGELETKMTDLIIGNKKYLFQIKQKFTQGKTAHFLFTYIGVNKDEKEINNTSSTDSNGKYRIEPNNHIMYDIYINPKEDTMNITKEILDFRAFLANVYSHSSFEKFVLKGSGDKVLKDISFNKASSYILLVKVENSDSNFFCDMTSENGKRQGLVNEIGNMKRVFFVEIDDISNNYYFQIESDGDWELTFMSLQEHFKFIDRDEQRAIGTYVSQAVIGDGNMHLIDFEYKGKGNVFVDFYDENLRRENLVNEIDDFTTEKMIKLEKNVVYFYVVSCDWLWRLRISKL